MLDFDGPSLAVGVSVGFLAGGTLVYVLARFDQPSPGASSPSFRPAKSAPSNGHGAPAYSFRAVFYDAEGNVVDPGRASLSPSRPVSPLRAAADRLTVRQERDPKARGGDLSTEADSDHEHSINQDLPRGRRFVPARAPRGTPYAAEPEGTWKG